MVCEQCAAKDHKIDVLRTTLGMIGAMTSVALNSVVESADEDGLGLGAEANVEVDRLPN